MPPQAGRAPLDHGYTPPIPQKRSWERPQSSPEAGPSGLQDFPETVRARTARDRPRDRQSRPGPQQPTSSASRKSRVESNGLEGLDNILRSDRINKATTAIEQGTETTRIKEWEERDQVKKPDVQRNNAGASQVWTPGMDVDSRQDSRSRHRRTQFKERGSLMSRLSHDVDVSSHSRSSRTPSAQVTTKEKSVKSPKAAKQVNVDVFIPTVVSVGNLARLLNVKLGTSSIIFFVYRLF